MPSSAPPVRPFSPFATYAAAILCLFLMLCALWIMPWRMRFEPGGSYYTYGYIPDEIFYAQRLQPLLPGAAPGNPLNGFTDPRLISQFYLEDALRSLVTFTGIDVIAFFWIWRLIFPSVLFATVLLVARKIIPRQRRPWGRPLLLAVAVAAWSGMYFLYDVLTEPLPLHCWIERVPTNSEYVLSLFLAAAAFVWCQKADGPSGAILAALAALTIYMRPYLAVPWMMALGILGISLLVSKRLKLRPFLTAVAVGALALVPWVYATHVNGTVQTHKELIERYFEWPIAYRVHDMAALHIALAAALGLCAMKIRAPHRYMVASSALALAILPFICAKVPPVARELLRSDRFGSFYIVLIISTFLLLLREYISSWRGTRSIWQARRIVFGAATVSLCFAAATAVRNFEHDLGHPPGAHYYSMVRENDFVPAYLWLREHSPADALVAVDDGYDWAKAPDDPEALFWKLKDFTKRNELFSIVARRRVLYTDWLMYSEISNAELAYCGHLQRRLFGMKENEDVFWKTLSAIRPAYVFWRKTPCVPVSREPAAVPRDYGARLRHDVVYSDNVCEIWKVNYSSAAAAGQPAGRRDQLDDSGNQQDR